jgi:hypothetical protein
VRFWRRWELGKAWPKNSVPFYGQQLTSNWKKSSLLTLDSIERSTSTDSFVPLLNYVPYHEDILASKLGAVRFLTTALEAGDCLSPGEEPSVPREGDWLGPKAGEGFL